MQTEQSSVKSNNYQVKQYGDLQAWAALSMMHPKLGKVPGKQFLRSELGLTSLEVSLNSIGPGKGVPFLHAHRQNEELYLFLSGKGQMLLDGEVVEIRAGSAVRVSPPVMRSWRNTGDEPLVCICIQAREGTLAQVTEKDGFLSEAAPAWPSA